MKWITTFLSLCIALALQAQSPVGIWKTFDDKTGREKSRIRIYETQSGNLQGEVVQILTPGKETATCIHCEGDRKNKPVNGMVILWGLKKESKDWSGGQIIDPENGKQYKCAIKLKGNDKLEVRGFIGISLIGRTQVWQRVD